MLLFLVIYSPICQDDLINVEETKGGENTLTFCRVSCGNSIHAKCMEVWSSNCLENHEKIKCPVYVIPVISDTWNIVFCFYIIPVGHPGISYFVFM